MIPVNILLLHIKLAWSSLKIGSKI